MEPFSPAITAVIANDLGDISEQETKIFFFMKVTFGMRGREVTSINN